MEEPLYMRILYVEKVFLSLSQWKALQQYLDIWRDLLIDRSANEEKLNKGRPKKLSLRDEQNIGRQIRRMRSKIGPFKHKTLFREAGFTEEVSMSTIPRVLSKHGFWYFHLRRKSIMKLTDFTKRVRFGWTALKCPMDFCTKNINFYLDVTGFTHKRNAHNEARSTKTMACRTIPYALPKLKELALVVGWHTL